MLFGKKDIMERWAEYIEEPYSDDRPDILTDTNSIHNTVKSSEMEVRVTIIKLPKGNLLDKGKSTGIDEIPAEFLQSMGNNEIERI